MLVRAFLLLALTALVCLPTWSLPDWDGTEGRRVQIALEMARSGDWMVPTLGGQATWAKPPLHYWLLATCESWLGHSPWAMRLPSVLGAFFAALLAGELLRRWFGARAGWVGALGVACSPLVISEWPTAEIDPLFATLTATSLWCLATGVARDRLLLVGAAGALGGLAILQKGPPYFLFAIGAYLVWWRHRRLRHASVHFAALLAVALAYYGPLWGLRVSASEMLTVVSEESLGRLTLLDWSHARWIPEFWLRAVLVQMPFMLWCFWEWRGARDARMDAGDLTLRMCSGAAVLAIVLLTFFPGRPTRYVLPNVLLFTFAVAPAVAHFCTHPGQVPPLARRLIRLAGVSGVIGLLVLPFVPSVGIGAVGFAAAVAVSPLLVRTPLHVVIFVLAVPVVGAWTLGLDRARAWNDGPRARVHGGRLLQRELNLLGVTPATLQTVGHVDSALLLRGEVLPPGDESERNPWRQQWVLREHADGSATPSNYVVRLRLNMPFKSFVLFERQGAPR